jgi:hypothetical protein
MKNLGFLKSFIRIYIPGSGAEAGPTKLWPRLQKKVAAPPDPAPQHCFKLFYTGNKSFGNVVLFPNFPFLYQLCHIDLMCFIFAALFVSGTEPHR